MVAGRSDNEMASLFHLQTASVMLKEIADLMKTVQFV